MIEENYDNTKKLKLFIRFFLSFDCSNQTSISSLEIRYFYSVKRLLLRVREADAV